MSEEENGGWENLPEDTIRPGYTRVSAISNAYAGYSAAPKDAVENARVRGEAVHKLIEKWLDDIPGIVGDLKPYMDSFNRFWHPFEESEILLKERRIYDEELKITGKCDLIARLDGVVTLLDWKCTYKTAKHWEIQAAGYHLLASNNCALQEKIDRIKFIRLRKDGKYPEVIEYEPKHDLFLKAYELYNMFMKNQDFNLEDE